LALSSSIEVLGWHQLANDGMDQTIKLSQVLGLVSRFRYLAQGSLHLFSFLVSGCIHMRILIYSSIITDAFQEPHMPCQIAVTQGNDRRENVLHALQLIGPTIDLARCRNIIIKPNLVSTVRQLAATHVDALRGLLDFIRQRYDGAITITEGAALAPTMQGYERFGYNELVKPYDVQLVDLNGCETDPALIYDRRLRPITVRLARPVVDSDFRISVSPSKTHNSVIVTLSIKNMVMGTLVNPSLARLNSRSTEAMIHPTSLLPGERESRLPQVMQLARMALPGRDHSDKMAMHQGCALINLNIARLAPLVLPHLAIIDGYEGMDGPGPNNGNAVDWHTAVAGLDAVAVDHLSSYLMGFDPARIGYLVYCRQMGLGVGDINQMEILGGLKLEDVRRAFRPHPDTQQQYAWRLPEAEKLLASGNLKRQ
jgi:uncharacterized protein (DUF362 family)